MEGWATRSLESLALRFAAEGKRVVGMTADGSFGMSCGEFETITRLNLPVVVIQCSNNAFGWIKELQHLVPW